MKLEQIAAERAAQHKDAELQRGVEEKRAAMELERLRATTVTQARIARESAQQKADAEFYQKSKEAEAHLVNQQAEANARAYRGEKDAQIAAVKKTRDAEANFTVMERQAEANLLASQKQAEADFIVMQKQAEANFIVKQKEAAGIAETAKAYGELAKVMGGPRGLMQYLMLQNNTYEKLALANAKAINGLQPKINVWNTGSAGGEGADPTAPIRNLFQTLPPLLSTIHDQTGMQPPAWFAKMPEQNGEMGDMTTQEKVRAKQEALMNGNGH